MVIYGGNEMSKKLVAYFSASGVTKSVSEKLANVSGADLFEIVPEEIYTKEDLDWQDKQSRSSIEMSDRNSRPAIQSIVEDMDQYDTVFIGFPVWWYREPSIIDTFLEEYNFDGKTLIPFCTSGSSDLGESVDNFKKLAPGANVIAGERFASNVSEEELNNFINNI